MAFSTLGMIEPQIVEVRFNHFRREPQRQRLIGVVQFEIVQSRAKRRGRKYNSIIPVEQRSLTAGLAVRRRRNNEATANFQTGSVDTKDS
ncbi:MAG: hypothetical protein HY231_04410 [Acidobacteria bacterium]|nr:hypothetical protein [Acidobacteriota bacterium]